MNKLFLIGILALGCVGIVGYNRSSPVVESSISKSTQSVASAFNKNNAYLSNSTKPSYAKNQPLLEGEEDQRKADDSNFNFG